MRQKNSMRLYLAGEYPYGMEFADNLDIQGFLVSYWYILNGKGWDVVKYANKRNTKVFLDSGAFSAFISGAKINLNDYIDFCKKYNHLFNVIASLDVIMDWKSTRSNHLSMREAGINSIPCFHVGEPFEFLNELVQNNDYIALGVAGNQSKHNSIMAWLIRCYQIIGRKKIHGFALTSPRIMASFQWYSVDSTAWLMAALFRRKYLEIENLRIKTYRIKIQDKNEYNDTFYNNAKIMLEWTQSLTRQRTKSNAI